MADDIIFKENAVDGDMGTAAHSHPRPLLSQTLRSLENQCPPPWKSGSEMYGQSVDHSFHKGFSGVQAIRQVNSNCHLGIGDYQKDNTLHTLQPSDNQFSSQAQYGLDVMQRSYTAQHNLFHGFAYDPYLQGQVPNRYAPIDDGFCKMDFADDCSDPHRDPIMDSPPADTDDGSSFDYNHPDVIASFLEKGKKKEKEINKGRSKVSKGLHKELVHRLFYTKVCHRARLSSASFFAVADSWEKKVAEAKVKAQQIVAEEKELTRCREELRLAIASITPAKRPLEFESTPGEPTAKRPPMDMDDPICNPWLGLF